MAIVLIGIDDTDNDTSPGTGQLARELAREIELREVSVLGITRHQFLLDDRIPYTTHNSGACLAVDWPYPMRDLEFAAELIGEWSAPGSDPGICLAAEMDVPCTVKDWGWAATKHVLTMQAAGDLAAACKLFLRALGGTGGGIIGAMASVGLRADGNEGRFLDLPGLRGLPEIVKLAELAQLGIKVDHLGPGGDSACTSAMIANRPERYKTMNWVRPRLVGGRAVWPVEWSEDERAWIPFDRKKSRPLE